MYEKSQLVKRTLKIDYSFHLLTKVYKQGRGDSVEK